MNSPKQKRILILDNDKPARNTLSLLLSSEGYEVADVGNGFEAVSQHRQNPFDLVIIELLLSRSEGFNTLVELRADSKPPKFIAMAKSGLMPADVHLKMARHLGAHETLAKPFAAEHLLSAVRNVLNS